MIASYYEAGFGGKCRADHNVVVRVGRNAGTAMGFTTPIKVA